MPPWIDFKIDKLLLGLEEFAESCYTHRPVICIDKIKDITMDQGKSNE